MFPIIKLLRTFILHPFRILNLIVLKINHVKFNKVNTFGFVWISNRGQIEFGNNIKINSSPFKNLIGGDTRTSIVVKRNACLRFGDNVKISNSAIYCANKIHIGNNVMIGGSCKIWDTNFHSLNQEVRNSNPNEQYKTEPIIIGNNVFIGGFSIILKGVEIGDNSIIGAGSVVHGKVPSGEIWAGNPAKLIRKIESDYAN